MRFVMRFFINAVSALKNHIKKIGAAQKKNTWSPQKNDAVSPNNYCIQNAKKISAKLRRSHHLDLTQKQPADFSAHRSPHFWGDLIGETSPHFCGDLITRGGRVRKCSYADISIFPYLGISGFPEHLLRDWLGFLVIGRFSTIHPIIKNAPDVCSLPAAFTLILHGTGSWSLRMSVFQIRALVSNRKKCPLSA